CRNLFGMRFQCEVPGIEEADHRCGKVALECFSALRQEEGIVLAPHGQKWWLAGSEIRLESRIKGDVALIVAEEIELNLVCTETDEIKVIKVLTIRRDHRLVGNAVGVLPTRRLRQEKRSERVSIGLRRVYPVCPDRIPAVAKAFLVGVAVLRDDGGDPLGVT